MMIKQASMRSLGNFLSFKNEDGEADNRPLLAPSVVEPPPPADNDDDDSNDFANSSDPLIGKTIDADQTIEDEVRNLLGLAPATTSSSVNPPIGDTTRDTITHSHSRSASNFDKTEGDVSAEMSRRSEFRKAKSGDGTGSRYLRCKHSASGRQRSVRRMTVGSDTADERPHRAEADNTSSQPVTGVPEDRRRTLTKIRKSSRRIQMVLSDSEEKGGDSSDPHGTFTNERKPVDQSESMRSRERISTKSSSQKALNKSWASSDGASFREDKHSSSRESNKEKTPAGSTEVRRMSLRDKRPSSRRLSTGSGQRSSGRSSLRERQRQSSRRVSETSSRRLPSRQMSSSEKRPSSRRLTGERKPSSRKVTEISEEDRPSSYVEGESMLGGLKQQRSSHGKSDDSEEEFFCQPDPGSEFGWSSRNTTGGEDKEVSSQLKPSSRNSHPPSERQSIKKSSSQSSSRRRRPPSDRKQRHSTRSREQLQRDGGESSGPTKTADNEVLTSSDDNDSGVEEVCDISDTNDNESKQVDQKLDGMRSSSRTISNIATQTSALSSQSDDDKAMASKPVSAGPRNSSYLEVKKRSSIGEAVRDPYWDKKKVVAEVTVHESEDREASVKSESEPRKVLSGDHPAFKDESHHCEAQENGDNSEDVVVDKTMEVVKDYQSSERRSLLNDTEVSLPSEIGNNVAIEESLSQPNGKEAETIRSLVGVRLHALDNDTVPSDVSHEQVALDNRPEASTSLKAGGSEATKHNAVMRDSNSKAVEDVDRSGRGIDHKQRCEVAENENDPSDYTQSAGMLMSTNIRTKEQSDPPVSSFTLEKPQTDEVIAKDDCYEVSERLKHFRLVGHDKGKKGDKRRRRLSDGMFWRSERGLMVESVGNNRPTQTEKDTESHSHSQGESPRARRRSESAVFIQGSINNFSLSPLSNTSQKWAQSRRKSLSEELKEDRWAPISPVRPINHTDGVAIRNEMLFSPSTDHIETWDTSSKPLTHETHTAPNCPPRQGSDNFECKDGEGREDTFATSSLHTQTISMSCTRSKQRSSNLMQGLTRSSAHGAHEHTTTELGNVSSFEASKQRLRDRWAPISPMQVIDSPQHSKQRRKSLGAMRSHGMRQNVSASENDFELIKQALKEDRWAPISPMRPIVAAMDEQKHIPLHLVPDVILDDKSQRWAASATNELVITDVDLSRATKAIERKRRDDLQSESEVSFDESLLEDDSGCTQGELDVVDDHVARAIAQQVAFEHSTHEKSIVAANSILSRKDSNDFSASPPSVWGAHNSAPELLNDQDDYARMIARKAALEHLIGEHMATLNLLKTELGQIESRIDAFNLHH